MKQATRTLVVLLAIFFSGKIKSQLSGTYAIPGSYASIAAAISDLNSFGVSGPVIINIAAGYTETVTTGGFTLNSITGASSTNQIAFQKSGSGANPLLYAYTGTATPASAAQDGVWRFSGSDYITIDGIDISDPNTTNPGTMEFGYGFFKASVTDGCQNNTIKNCVITLNRVNNASGTAPATDGARGIDVVNATTAAHTTALTITAASGSNSNNKFYGNTIQNCNIGIAVIGFVAATPFTLGDTGNEIGGVGASQGNTIINFGGGGTTASAGIRTSAQYSLIVTYNVINNNNGSGVSHTGDLRGIYVNTALSANSTISNNTVTVRSVGTTAQLTGIDNASGSTAASNAVTIQNNLITNCTYTTATSGNFYGILNSATPATLVISSNTLTSNSTSAASGSYYNIYNSGATPLTSNVSLNTINNISLTASATSATFRGIFFGSANSSALLTISNNSIQSVNYSGTGSGDFSFIHHAVQAGTIMVIGNVATGLSIPTTGSAYFMNNSNSTQNITFSSNMIVGSFSKTGAGGTVYGYYNFGSPGGGNVTISNNNISNVILTGATPFYGLFHATAVAQNVSITNNIVSNIVGGTSGVNGIYFSYGNNNNVISGNSITGLSSTSGTISGINIGSTASTSLTIGSNTIGALSSASATSVYGYYQQSGTATSIYKNKIYDLVNTATTTVVYGMNLISGTTNNIYNNIIGDLRTPSVIATNPLIGISLTGGTTHNLSFNTIYLSATSNGSLFGSSAVSANSTPTSISLKNNLFINNSVATGTGIATALRSSTVPTNYASTSNNNCFYAGTPGTANLIFYDGTNALQTIAAFKTAVNPADANSVTENTGFLSTTASNANFLHVNNTFTTLTESGGINVSGIADDIDGQIRAGNSGYAGSGSSPDIGADENEPNLPTCTSVSAGNIAVTSYSRCASQTVVLTSTGTVLGGSTTFQWKESTTSGGPYTNVASGSGPNSPAYTSGGLSAGVHYFVLVSTCPAISGTNTSNEVTVSVNPYPTANVTVVGSNTVCSFSNLSFNGTTDIGTNFQWYGPGGLSSTSQNPTFSNIPAASAGIYTFVASANGCSTTALSSNITITSGPTQLTLTPLNSTICAGSTQTFNVSGGLTTLPLNVGTNTNTNTTSSYPSPYSLLYGGQRFQFMVLASELTAAGFAANTPITALNLPVVSFASNWGSTRFDVQNLKISMGATSATSLSTMVTTLTTVYGPVNYTPTVGYNNMHNFSTPFIWNGTDNVVIETAFSNNFSGTVNDAVITYTTATSFQSSILYRVDGVAAATVYTTTTVNSSFNARPDFKLYGSIQGTYNWSSGLSSATGASVTGSPAATSSYTVGVTYGSCTVDKVANITVLNTPTVNLVATNTLLCGSASSTLTATGASSYLWNTGATTSSIVVSPGTNTVYSIVGTNAPCPITGSANISITATNNPIVNIGGSSGICTGQTASLTATGASTYLWNTGSTSDNITDTPSSNTTYTVTGTDALGCSTTTTQLVTVAASLSISIVGPSTICVGQTVVLQDNGGVTYQWDGGATTASISINPTINTTYSIIGASGTCSNTAMLTVTVNSNPTFAIGGNTTICSGNTTTLTASGTAATYSWNTGAGTATVAVSPTANTTYTATGYSSAGCAVVHTVAVVSNSLPVISIATTATAVCVNATASLTASGANTYTWVTSGNPTSTQLTVSPTANTIYTVNGTNAANCVSSKTISITSYSIPVLSIAPASATVCALTPVNLTASGADSFTWSASGGSNSAVSYTPSASTVYSVSGTNSLGCSSMTTVAITTNSLPLISISPASMTLCSLAPASFTASGASSYVWNGATIGSTFTSISAASTVYSVTGYNSNNCGATQTVAAIALPLPVIAVTPSFVTVCNLSTGVYTVSGASTYVWQDNSTATTVAITPSTTTSFSVAGTDANGCTGQGAVVILTTPSPVLTVSPVSASVCPNTAQSFTAQGAITYSWSNGPTTAVSVITPSISGIYTVTGSNGSGCTGTATVNLTTKAVPVIAISPSTSSLCLNSAGSFTASGATSYTWNTGSMTSDIYVAATTSTVYTVSGKNALGCTGSATVGLHVWQPPVIGLSASAMTLCAKETVTLNASGAATYTWYPFNVTGSVLTNAASNTTQYNIVGVDVNGCSNTATITITADKCTGIEKKSSLDNAVHMYPNPSTGMVTADFDFDGKKEIVIANSTGAVVAVMTTENRSESFNLSEMAKGVYFVRVITSAASANYKIVIQ